MIGNFDFLKSIDKELYSIIEDAQSLFRDEYFNQTLVQLRIFAENIAKKVLGEVSSDMTLDDILNCLKDKIKSEQEKEFIEDLFFIKKMGNKAAHGEDILASEALEAIERIFEVSINYAYSKKKNDKFLNMQFDKTLLITEKPTKEVKLIDKYLQAAQQQKEELLKSKQIEFNSKVEKKDDEVEFKDKYSIKNAKNYKKTQKKKKELTPQQEKIKSKIKEAKKNLKQNINKTSQKSTKKSKKKESKKPYKLILFIIFVTISLIILSKMLYFSDIVKFCFSKILY